MREKTIDSVDFFGIIMLGVGIGLGVGGAAQYLANAPLTDAFGVAAMGAAAIGAGMTTANNAGETDD